ncbi:unnamed protein product [Brugia timori]|uniref:Ovule protein n=1 Tax=Brugia timori TaxID=42155 RepID=A0A0R3RAX9_9BILA|nr:unnamed protein product [Brugia timori]
MDDNVDICTSVIDDSMDATEALAVDVVESLFDRSGLAETSCTAGDFDNQNLVKSNNENDVLKSGNGKPTSLTELISGKKKEGSVSKEQKEKDETVISSSDAVDSWEELDNDDYSSKLVNEVRVIT